MELAMFTEKTESTDYPEPFSSTLERAREVRATDIHLDPVEDCWKLSHRINGIIHDAQQLSDAEGTRLLNQIKVAARFGTDRCFHPMENRISHDHSGVRIGLRVTLVPTLGKEAVHIRFLLPPANIFQAENLGTNIKDLETIQEVIRQSEGLILVAGPTGAGKTMTMYSLASMLENRSQIAVSVEDPIEFDLPFIRQVEVDEDHGLTMANGLKTILRMDPDLILVGEIRDHASAQTALRAAASGHFVISTIHAVDALAAIEVLQDSFQVPNHLLGGTLRMIITQTLIRRLCENCKVPRKLSESEQNIFRDHDLAVPETTYQPGSCSNCNNSGYENRTGIFQVAAFDRNLCDAISKNETIPQLRKRFQNLCSDSPHLAILRKVAAGETTIQEYHQLPPEKVN